MKIAEIQKLSTRSAIFLTCLLFIVAFHYFIRFIGRAPYVAVDDSLANISVYLSNSHSYGMPVAPVEIGGRSLRLGHMLNYGPVTFFFGAILDWIFGTSYAIQRTVHPLMLAIMTAIAFFTFRREQVIGAGAFSAALVFLFWTAQWPMFRPDIVTAALLLATIAAGTAALRQERLSLWWVTGLMAASAAANHQIAWAAVPCSFLVWLLSLRIGSGITATRRIRTFLSFAFGGICGALIYCVAIGFHLGLLISMWEDYAALTANLRSDASFLGMIRLHYVEAWSNVASDYVVGLYGIALVSLFALIAALVGKGTAFRRETVCLLGPSVIIAVGYQLSLGLYTNTHSGYGLPTQITTIWIDAAFFALLFYFMNRYGGNALRMAGAIASLLLICTLLGASLYTVAKIPNIWQTRAKGNVAFADYRQAVLGGIPRGAKTFGDITFGLDAGSSSNYLYVSDGIDFTSWLKPSFAPQFAPTYLVLNHYVDALFEASLRENAELSAGLFAGFHYWGGSYTLQSLVDAPPYGTTRIYRRETARDAREPSQPTTAVYLPDQGIWGRQFGPPLSIPFETAKPVQMSLSSKSWTAVSTLKGSLPAATYLVSVSVSPQKTEAMAALPCFVVATRSDSLQLKASDLGFGFPIAPCFSPNEGSVSLIVRHEGGDLYLSLFSGGSRDFLVRNIRRLYQPESESVPLPPLSEWTVTAKGGRMTFTQDGGADFTGDNTAFGYQLQSPRIPIPSNSSGEVHLELTNVKCPELVGVLGFGDSKWIHSNSSSSSAQFDAQGSPDIRVVIMNDNEPPQKDCSTTFHLKVGSLRMAPPIGSYLDEIAACSPINTGPKPEYCARSESERAIRATGRDTGRFRAPR